MWSIHYVCTSIIESVTWEAAVCTVHTESVIVRLVSAMTVARCEESRSTL